jgi:STE24 endopeptidase
MVAFEQRITVKNVADPAPPRWQRVLLATHPATVERIGQALAAKARRSPAAA